MSHGQRTLPGTIDELALESGDSVWARYPASPEAFERGDLHAVTFSALANAINRLAWFLDTILPEHGDLDTVCYIGPSDIRYFILACAACKCRLKALFSSPRNNTDAHLSLLDATNCRVLLGASKSPDSTSQTLTTSRKLKYESIPSLEELLKAEIVDSYPWSYSFEQVAHEPFLVLHTSGSTGQPKPVNNSHGLIATIDAQQDLPDVEGRSVTARRWVNTSVYTALPPFHSAGINFFAFSVFQHTQLILGPCNQPPSLQIIERVLDLKIADAAIIPPSLLAEVAADEGLLEKTSQWSSVAFGGGPLAQAAGNALWQRTKILQLLGSTETFNVPELEPQSIDEWEYHWYHPSLNIEFKPHPEDLHELVFRRDKQTTRHQGAFWTFSEQEEYSMKDLYERHPTKPGCWKYRGRIDDIIVLSNGEKFNPTGAEKIMSQNEIVKSALIVGASREQPVVLIEPADLPGWDPERRRTSIVEAVERANETLPAHAQIHESHVRVLDSSNAFLRSAKGEVRRAPTNDAFGEIIEEVYRSAEQASTSTELNLDNEEQLTESLTHILAADYVGSDRLAKTDNVFDCGMDSLRVVKLLRMLKGAIRQKDPDAGSDLTTRMIYQNPTPQSMARILIQSMKGEAAEGDETEDVLHRMQSQLDALRDRLTQREQSHAIKTSPKENVVVLTGSTGSLGSYILDSLIKNVAVSRVICLNRAGGDAKKQSGVQQSRGLCTEFSKVEFLEADLAKKSLGLQADKYGELVRHASHVIHNAWPVNFNLALSSFEPQLEGCLQLATLANDAEQTLEINFLSSIGAANNWPSISRDEVPEVTIDDLKASEGMGYAQSKQLAELLLAHASKVFEAPVTICRLGQIAGPVKSDKGMWNPNEWFPSVIRSSKALGKLPESLGAMDCIDWIPVDLLADMLVEMIIPAQNRLDPEMVERMLNVPDMSRTTTRSASPSARSLDSASDSPALMSSRTSIASDDEPVCPKADTSVVHFVNPHKTQWPDLVHSLIDEDQSEIKIVPFEEWLQALSEAAEHEDAAETIPAVKLVNFYGDIGQPDAKRPEFSTKMTQRRSALLRGLDPVSLDWLKLWQRQWHQAGA